MDSNIETGPTNYTVNGRIMLSSVIILFFVVSIMICFHSYARWFLYRRRRRFGRSAGDLFSNPVFPVTTASAGSASPQGLDLSILNTLPVFIYSSTTAHDPLPECAVCLSEFENEEHGRVLPVCKHAFHIECIDAWFQFHSNCPLCRAPVHFHIPVQYLPETSTETTLITVNEPPVSQSQLDDLGEAEMGSTGSSTQVILSPEWCHRKSGSGGLYFSVYIPSATERGLELEGIGFGSSETQYQFQSPANRTLSLKRIWSI